MAGETADVPQSDQKITATPLVAWYIIAKRLGAVFAHRAQRQIKDCGLVAIDSPMELLVFLTLANTHSITVPLRSAGAWVPAPPATASNFKFCYRLLHAYLPAGASNLLARFEKRICSEQRHAMRRCFIPRHRAQAAPPICADDFGAALYVSPPP